MTDDPAGYRRVTSFDVARLAGVSRAAVSRAFTADASISQKTRAKVEEAAERLGYRVNYLARSLNGNRSDLVGVVAAAFDNPFRAMQIEALSHELLKRNFRPILLPTTRASDVSEVIEQVLNYAVSGVLVTSDAPSSSLCQDCARQQVPIVLINKGDAIPFVDRVVSDDAEAGKIAFERLVGRGARRLVMIAGTEVSFSARQRSEAFLRLASERGIAASLIEVAVNNYSAGFSAAQKLADVDPDGLFCANDYLACGVLDRLKVDPALAALRGIPVIGHDNIPQASWDAYALTTIAQPCDVQAEQAIDLLTSRIAEPTLDTRTIVTPVRLHERNSG